MKTILENNFRKQFALCLLVGIPLFFASCKKEKITSNPEVQSEPEKYYYLNEKEVSENELTYDEANSYVVEFRNKPTGANARGIVNEKRVFTSKEKYIEFGEKFGFKFKELLEFEKIMQEIANQDGLIEEYDKTGILPQWYVEREKVVYDSLFNIYPNPKSKQLASAFVALYDNYEAQGSSITMAATWPAMPAGWNNRVSCIQFFGFAGGVNLFDRTFYRSKLTTIYDWGLYKINLAPGIDNKTSSAVRFF